MKILNTLAHPEARTEKTRNLMLLVLAMLLIVGVQTLRFDDQNLREDEINTIHAAHVLSYDEIVTEWLAFTGAHPPGWRWLASAWVKTFGGDAGIVRFQSTLFTLLALAFIYRLGRDVFDTQVGLIAVLFIGLQPFFHWHTHELRPYALLTMTVAASHVVWLYWLRYQTFRYALLYVLLCIIGIQTHYFMVYVIAAQFLTMLALVRYDRLTYLRGFGLAFAAGLSLLAWILPMLYGTFVQREGGIDYAITNDFAGLQLLFQDMQMLPVVLLPALAIPVTAVYTFRRTSRRPLDSFMRSPAEWPRWYVMALPGFMLLLAFAVNLVVSNVTQRNMIILVPSLAVLAAYLLRALVPSVRLVAVGLIVLSGLAVFHHYYQNPPYSEMLAYMEPEFNPQADRVVTMINRGNAGTTAMVFHLLENWRGELQMDDIFSVAEPYILSTYVHEADPFVYYVQDDDPATRQQFEQFIAGQQRIWYVRYEWLDFYGESALATTYEALLAREFQVVMQRDFPLIHRDLDYGDYTVILYERRGEDDPRPIFGVHSAPR